MKERRIRRELCAVMSSQAMAGIQGRFRRYFIRHHAGGIRTPSDLHIPRIADEAPRAPRLRCVTWQDRIRSCSETACSP
jgi:hypothetical protein